MAESNNNGTLLEEAIQKGMDEVGEQPPVTETEKEEKKTPAAKKTDTGASAKEEDEEEESGEESPESDPSAFDLDAVQGKQLIQGLRDPAQRALIVDFLAKQAGYTKRELKAAEPEDVKADVVKMLEEELGPEFKFLAPKIGNGLKRYLDSIKPANNPDLEDIKTTKERLDAIERVTIQREIESTHSALAKEYFNSTDMPDKVIKKMTQAMKLFPPSDSSIKPDTYYRKIFGMVAHEMGISKKSASASKDSNRGPASQMGASNRGVTPKTGVASNGKMSLTQAIEAAINEVGDGSEK